MNNRVTSDGASSVSLFPFLAVLLCTMGALLVLLVVLAQRAGQRVVAEANPPATDGVGLHPQGVANSPAVDNLVDQLKIAQENQRRLTALRRQAQQRLLGEQQRLTHSEEHTRRLEHELAGLSLAAEQLTATEQHQAVDQQQAEHEVARLQQLIKDAAARLQELRDQSHGRRSYAIVPYRGPHGTYRKPIYIECRQDAIILHPEGIRLQPSDFAATSWPGNPLAAAIRATRDHLNAEAAKAGASEPPDPYPMILVRPDGIRQYHLARAAIKSWDATYGYEFIKQDWELSFPELPDPQLARIQQHAIMVSRERLARLVRSAPRRFGGGGPGSGGSRTGGPGTGAGGSGRSGLGDGDDSGAWAGDEAGSPAQLGQSQAAGSGIGNSFAANGSNSETTTAGSPGAENRELQLGAMAGENSAGGQASAAGGTDEGTSESAQGFAAAANAGRSELSTQGGELSGGGGSSNSSGGGGGGGDGGRSCGCNTAAAGGAEASAGGGRGGGAAASGSLATAGGRASAGETSSIAAALGRNWAVQSGSPGAVAIRRPIRVVVRQDQLTLLPSRHTIDGDLPTGRVISLNQSSREISHEFVTALRERVEAWGLAGNGLYWRPVLKLDVGPGAERTANQVRRLLEGSGVDASLPDTARAPHRGNLEGTTDATR